MVCEGEVGRVGWCWLGKNHHPTLTTSSSHTTLPSPLSLHTPPPYHFPIQGEVVRVRWWVVCEGEVQVRVRVVCEGEVVRGWSVKGKW